MVCSGNDRQDNPWNNIKDENNNLIQAKQTVKQSIKGFTRHGKPSAVQRVYPLRGKQPYHETQKQQADINN
jgi:hypothetical protein